MGAGRKEKVVLQRLMLALCALSALLFYAQGWLSPTAAFSLLLVLAVPAAGMLLRWLMTPYGNRVWVSYLSIMFDCLPYFGIFLATLFGVSLSLELVDLLETPNEKLNKILSSQAVGIAIGALSVAIFEPLKAGQSIWSGASSYKTIVQNFVSSQSLKPEGNTLTYHAIYSDIVPDHSSGPIRGIKGWAFGDRIQRARIIESYWSTHTSPTN